jgi:glycosyltransferase involved in cell wall biosynthesis
VAGQVGYHGYVPPEEMPALYQRQVCAWVPSLWQEPFGLVSVESQAGGTPVVVSRVGGLPETLEEGVTGLVTPPGDAAALAEATERILADENTWEALSEAGREFAARHFRVARMVAAVEESLVEAARPGGS